MTRPANDSDDEPLTAAQVRELRRRAADLEDRTRYLLASVFSSRFVLYYDVSGDVWAYKDPQHGTLFKRRATALAVRQLLGPRVRVVRCRVDRAGALVPGSLRGLRRSRPRR